MLEDRITKDQFLDYLDTYKKNDDLINKLYRTSDGLIDFTNLNDALSKPLRKLEKIIFTPYELDIISWYLYEDVSKKIYDSKTNEIIAILDSDEALWNYLNK
jgi:hypothetical protein